ncbi:transferase family-domain-containing protein [Hypoxylon sp. NC1633]|nr:transferase family-domain-containing protein [Hypoxylon sp. NC1633]
MAHPRGPAGEEETSSADMWTLSPLDAIMPDINLCIILCFACADFHQERTANILRQSYAQLVSDNPILAATISPAPAAATTRPGSKIVRPAEGGPPPPLRIRDGRNDITESYAELRTKAMPSSHLKAALVLPGLETAVPGVRHTAAAQATFIQDGCLLALNTSHALMDATGVSHVFTAWAKYAAAISTSTSASASALPPPVIHLTPSHTDAATLNPRVGVGAHEYHSTLKHVAAAWHMLGLDYRPRHACSAVLASRYVPRGTASTRLFHVGASALQRLKDECCGAAAAARLSTGISTNDALAALIWRSVVSARKLGNASANADADVDSDATTLMVAMSVRDAVAPPIGPTYLGNVVLYAIAESSVKSLASPGTESSLGSVAQGVREAIKKHRDPEAIQTALRLAASIPDVGALGLVYPTWLENDVVISSLYHLPLPRSSWGSTFGGNPRPDFVRFPQGMFEGICFVMPKREDGSVEVSITMYEGDMAELVRSAAFTRYATQLW